MKTHTPRAPVFDVCARSLLLGPACECTLECTCICMNKEPTPHHTHRHTHTQNTPHTHTHTHTHTHNKHVTLSNVGTNCSCLKEFLSGSSQPWHTSSCCLLNLVAAHDLQIVWPQGVMSSCMLTSSLPQKLHGVFVLLFLLLFKV